MNPEPSVFPFSVETSISQKEYEGLIHGVMRRSRWNSLLMLGITFILGALISLYFTGITQLSPIQMCLAFTGLILLLAWFRICHRWSKNYLKNPQMQHPIIYQFDEKGIASSGHHFTSTTDWDLIQRIAIINGFVLLYTSSKSAYLIGRSSISAIQLAAIEGKIKK